MGIIAKIICGILVAISSHLYGMPAYVSDIADDMVRFTDYVNEHDWYWEHAGDWKIWDDADLVMFDCFTPENPYDDVIVTPTKTVYETYVTEMKGEV